MRRGLVVAVLLGILGVIAWWLLSLEKKSGAAADPWDLLPMNTAVILEVPDPLETWARFTSTSQQWTAWDSTPGCATLNALLVRVREVAEADAGLKRAARRSSLLVALSPQGEAFSTLLIWAVSAEPEALAGLGPALGADLGSGSAIWQGGRISIQPDPGSAPLELAFTRGLLLISGNKEVLTDAMNGNATGPTADPLFLRARTSLGAGSDAHVLVNMERAQRLLTTWIKPDALRELEGVHGWAALDMRLRPEAALLSGLYFTEHPPLFLAALRDQQQGRASIARVLPAQARELRQAFIADARRFSEAIANEGSESLYEGYGAWVHGSIGTAVAGTPGDSSHGQWAVLQAEDPQRAMDALRARCTSPCDTLSYRGVSITQCADTGALGTVWGPAFDEFAQPWWCVLGDKVVLSGQPNALRASIDAWMDGTSLAQDIQAGGFLQRYVSESGFSWWVNAPGGLEAIRPAMKARGLEELGSHRDGWMSFGGALLQVSPESQNTFQVTACIARGGGTGSDESGALWSVALGTNIQAGPYLIDDHLSRTKQILVQDAKQRISLISCTGKVLWQREIDGPILGEVRQVDRFKNGKLQMLFNTAEHIHLIDRNGRDVAPFPIRLPEKASAPLSVFDYDGKREYRVLVPTVDAHLLNYDLEGKAVQGWVPPSTPTACDVPVQHLRIRGKDHLVLVDQGGRVTVLDRRGQPRYDPKLNVQGASWLVGLQPALDIGGCRLLWVDTLGNSLGATFDGAIDTLARAPEEPGGRAGNGINVADLNHDGNEELVLWKGGEVSAISGALPYPPDRVMRFDQVNGRTCDINRDDVVEKVLVFSNGRVTAQRAIQ